MFEKIFRQIICVVSSKLIRKTKTMGLFISQDIDLLIYLI